MFWLHSILMLLKVNSEKVVYSHTSQGQRSNIKHIVHSLQDQFFLSVFCFFFVTHALTWKGTIKVHGYAHLCTSVARKNVQTNRNRNRTRKHSRTQRKEHIYTWNLPQSHIYNSTSHTCAYHVHRKACEGHAQHINWMRHLHVNSTLLTTERSHKLQ